MKSKFLAAVVGVLLLAILPIYSAPQVQWQRVYPNPTASWLTAATWGPPGFVAVGREGEFLFSADAIQWKRSTVNGAEKFWLNGVCYYDGKYVAVGSGSFIALSTNAEDWSVVNASTNGVLLSCAGGAGTFVAVGIEARMLVSSNGVDWDERATPTTFVDIAFGNGLWVAVTGGSTVYTSSNLADWTSIQTQIGGIAFTDSVASGGLVMAHPGGLLTSVAFGNGRFVAGGAGGPDLQFGGFGTVIQTSADGLTWQTITGLNSLGEARDVAFAGGRFVAVSKWNFLRSADGLSWQAVTAPEAGGDLSAVAGSDEGCFVAVGSKGAMARSDHEATWQVISKDPRVDIHSIAWAKGRFVAVGGSPTYIGGTLGDAAVLSSTNGRDWQTTLTNLTDQLTAVAYGNRVWVVTGDDGHVFTSRNGVDWTDRSLPPTSHDLRHVVYGRGLFLAFADSRDLVYRSATGRRWRASEAQFASEIWKTKYLNRRFIGVGGDDDGFIFTSRNGIKWTKKTLPGAGWFAGVAYGAKRYVAAGRSASAVSSDGANWSVFPIPRIVYDLQYIDGWFIGVGPNGMLFSRDGVEWQISNQSEWPATLSLLSSGAGTLVGCNGPTLHRGALQDDAMLKRGLD